MGDSPPSQKRRKRAATTDDGDGATADATAAQVMPLLQVRALLDSVEWLLERGDGGAALLRCTHAEVARAVLAGGDEGPSWWPTLQTCGFRDAAECPRGAQRVLDAVAANCALLGVCVARRAPGALLVHVVRDDCVVILYGSEGDGARVGFVRGAAALRS
jgi:hypothetical protein